ncbi:hypothetical protein L9F63_015541, partial [Diploptera punctata]
MATVVSTKCLSLVEQKRIQWARERQELAGLCAPWGPPSTRREQNYRTCIRTRFVSSTTDLTRPEELRQQEEVSCSYNYSDLSSELQAAAERMRRKRSPSLPPIYSRTVPTCQDEDSMKDSHQYGSSNHEDEGEGETSGYASDSGGTLNDRNIEYCYPSQHERFHRQDNWMSNNQYEKVNRRFNKHSPWIPTSRRYGTPDSVVSSPPCRLWSSGGSDEVNRLRWGDRGVGVGHLWEPTLHEPDSRLPQVQGNGRGTPGWLERGLSKLNNCESSMGSSTQVLVINHGSPEQSTISRDFSASCDTISTQSQNECNRWVKRIQIELETLHYTQIHCAGSSGSRPSLLEERERKRKEEKERRIREEREEEERIKREQDIERKRIEEEQRRQKEKEDKEIRKAAAMREALENAEKKAREEKSRASRKHVLESVNSSQNSLVTNVNETRTWFESQPATETCAQNNTTSVLQDGDSKQSTSEVVTARHQEVVKQSDATQTLVEGCNEAVLIAAETVAMPADGLAVVIGNTTDGSCHDIIPTPGGGVQLALLMSPSLPQPLMLDNRLLTPSKYRLNGRERGTQTDSEIIIRNRRTKDRLDNRITRKDRKKSASLERPHKGCKLPLRCRSQSQPTQPRMRLEDRPKWGVNRPGTQYIKQSEKDPYYQRRLRQRLLRSTMMGCGDTGTESDTGSHRRPLNTRGSSDENSRSPSPQQRSYHGARTRITKNVHIHNGSKILDRNANIVDDQDENEIVTRDYCISTPSKRVQVVVPSENVTRRKGLYECNNKLHRSRRLLNRQAEMPVIIDSSSEEQWSTAKDILSQLSTLRQ